MKKHTILFLAANPSGTDRLALDKEARAIQVELERSGFRNRFEFVTRWAAEPLDLLRELRRLKPTVVHFSGHGSQGGLYFQDSSGLPSIVTTEALEATFGAVGSSVKLVLLSACYTEPQAKALIAHVDCVVGTAGAILDTVARSFAIGFYGGLGERASVAAAYKHGCAAIRLERASGSPIRDVEGEPPSSMDEPEEREQPQLTVRCGVNGDKLLAQNLLHPRDSATVIAICAALSFALWLYLSAQEHLDLSDIHAHITPSSQTPGTELLDGRKTSRPKPLTMSQESEADLVIDDIILGFHEQRRHNVKASSFIVSLDIRVRNSGRATVNLTRASLRRIHGIHKIAPPIAWCTSYAPSAVYSTFGTRKVSGARKPRPRLEGNIIAIAHVIKPGEIDNFVIEIDSRHKYIGETIALALTYNGTLEATWYPLFLPRQDPDCLYERRFPKRSRSPVEEFTDF